FFFFSSRRRHTRFSRDWSSDVCSSDLGYDNKKIQNAIAAKHWHFIIALGKTRSVKSAKLDLTTPKSKQWCHIAMFFRNHRWRKRSEERRVGKEGRCRGWWNY